MNIGIASTFGQWIHWWTILVYAVAGIVLLVIGFNQKNSGSGTPEEPEIVEPEAAEWISRKHLFLLAVGLITVAVILGMIPSSAFINIQ